MSLTRPVNLPMHVGLRPVKRAVCAVSVCDDSDSKKTHNAYFILGFSINKPFLWVLKLFPCFLNFC